MFGNKKKVSTEAMEEQMIALMLKNLDAIYSNKSSEEYKTHGDITLISVYKDLDRMITDLKTIKKFPTTYAEDIRKTFDELHRPVWKKNVSAYIRKPDEENTMYTAIYTVAVRVLIDEVSRIYTCTKASTKGGIEYDPSKLAKRKNLQPFFAYFNESIETKIAEYAKKHQNEPVTESFEAVGKFFATMGHWIFRNWIKEMINMMKATFKAIKQLNPITLANAYLINKYDREINIFKSVCANYDATKQAYEEYISLPANKQNPAIIKKYEDSLQALDNRKKNLLAKIEHFNTQAEVEASDDATDIDMDQVAPDNNGDSNKSDDAPTNTDGFDF